jgi:hypothetical protein
MSERRRKSGSSEGRGKRILVWSGWGLAVLLLGGNLVIALVNKKGDTPQSLITDEHVQTYGFWAAVDVAAIASAAGLFWAWRAYKQSERSTLRWAQWACAAGLVGAAFFAATSLDEELLQGRWLTLGFALVFCLQSVLVAALAHREHWRSVHGDSRAHQARRDAASMLDTSALPPIPGAPPESAGPAK